MTSLAELGSRTGSRGRLLWLALALSLTLNVCFVGGLIWSLMRAQPFINPAQRMQQITRELALSDDQRAAFKQFVMEIRHRSQELRESNQPLVERVWQELGKPQPDQDAIAKLVDQATENRHAYQKDMTVALSHFLANLTPEQRSRFIELAKQPQERLRHLIMP